MKFPSLPEVEAASREQLCAWYRFLPSAMGDKDISAQKRIYDHWKEVGGFTPEISKSLGWGDAGSKP